MEESILLKKRTFRENIANIRRVHALIQELDGKYTGCVLALVLLDAVLLYGGMLLSAYIINALELGGDFGAIIRIAVLATVSLSIGASVKNQLNKLINLKNKLIAEKYRAMQQEKLMQMDFSLIESPKLKELRERIRTDNNWGAGIHSMFWTGRAMLSHIGDWLGALVLAAPLRPGCGRALVQILPPHFCC